MPKSLQPAFPASSVPREGAPGEQLLPPPFGGPEPSWISGRYSDDVWRSRFVNPSVGSPYSFDFRRVNASHREYAKWFLWLHEYCPEVHRRGSSVPSAGSFCSHFTDYLFLTEVMLRNGHADMIRISRSELTEALEERLPGRAKGALRAGRLSKGRLSQLGVALFRLYRFGPAGLGYLPDGLSFDPTDCVRSVSRLCRSARRRRASLTEESALTLSTKSFEWVERVAPALIDYVGEWLILDRDLDHRFPGRFKEARRRARRAHFEGRRQRLIVERLAALLPRGVFDLRSEDPKGEDLLALTRAYLVDHPGHAAPILIDLMQAASYILIAILSGHRASEILSIRSDGIVRRGRSISARTTILKTSPRQGGTPVERPVPPAVDDVHRVLVALVKLRLVARRSRQRAQSASRPAASSASANPIVFAGGLGGRITLTSIRTWIGHFARICDVDDRIHAHQFRRFFAFFYIRRYRGPLDALRRQFRHSNPDMILVYVEDAVGARYYLKEKREFAQELAWAVMTGESGYTGLGHEAGGRAYRANSLALPSAEDQLRAAIRSKFHSVHAMEWGYCLVQAHDTAGAACGTNQAGPNDVLSAPETCSRCRHFVTGPENAGYWESTRLLHESIVLDPLATPIAKQLSAKLVERASSVLSRLASAASLTVARSTSGSLQLEHEDEES